MQFVRIPRERVGVLIGKKGEVKRAIEERCGAKLEVDSSTGDVTINTDSIHDPALVLKVADVVKAIGRGFAPETAFNLFQDDIYFDLLDIRDYVGKRPKHVRRMRARVIGSQGKTRRLIEELSSTHLSIQGNTVGIIGGIIELDIARTAVDMLLSGSEHSAVYRFLENKRKELRMAEMGLEY